MANQHQQQNYYTNPAFCQQSEFYEAQLKAKGISPTRRQTPRQSPVGANVDAENYEEQEFYEEMLVDDSGFVKRKNLVVVTSPNIETRNVKNSAQISRSSSVRYAPVNHHRYEEIAGGRYEEIQDSVDAVYAKEDNSVDGYSMNTQTLKKCKDRYEYVQVPQEERELCPKQVFREELDANAIKEGYALVRRNNRYELISLEKISDTYRYNQPPQPSRYEYVAARQKSPERHQGSRYETTENVGYSRALSPQTQRRGNPAATQRLHELLATPKKMHHTQVPNRTPQKVVSPRSPRKVSTPTVSPVPKDPFVTPPKMQQAQRPTPRAQQKLNYAIGARQMYQDKRHTAIIAPICSSPIQAYSETTYSNKSESWMNLSISKAPVQTTLAVAAFMMVLCGGVTSALCFYMVSIMGRLYYLDFGIVAGFTCLVLGMLGYRTRNCYWLPHRNYISGKLSTNHYNNVECRL